jgi:flagellar basal body-associated protein FliL
VSVWLKLILPAVVGAAALAGVVAYITSAERAKGQRDAAERRIENIQTSQEIEDAVQSLDPDAHWLELCERLSACGD